MPHTAFEYPDADVEPTVLPASDVPQQNEAVAPRRTSAQVDREHVSAFAMQFWFTD